MIIKHFQLKTNINKNTFLYLLYGPNFGLIEETINNVLKPNFTKNIFNYDENEILANTNKFEESILNKSFFDDEKLVIINRSSDKILNVIKSLNDKGISETVIFLKSGSLDKKSKLRNYFEKEKDLCCVPFYEENYQSLHSISQDFFVDKKIKISTESINLIIERSKGNRINLRNELEKINNFSKKKKIIEYEDVVKLTNLSENYDISQLVDSCLSMNKKKTINILNENIMSEENNVLILKSFLFKLKRLKKIKKQTEKTKNVEETLLKFKPPIFWKDKDIVKQQLKSLSLIEINKMIKDVNRLELLVKKNLQISSQIVNNFVLERLKESNNLI